MAKYKTFALVQSFIWGLFILSAVQGETEQQNITTLDGAVFESASILKIIEPTEQTSGKVQIMHSKGVANLVWGKFSDEFLKLNQIDPSKDKFFEKDRALALLKTHLEKFEKSIRKTIITKTGSHYEISKIKEIMSDGISFNKSDDGFEILKFEDISEGDSIALGLTKPSNPEAKKVTAQ